MATPQWAIKLAEKVCPGVELTWRRSRNRVSSSGRYITSQHRITLTAGSKREDQRLVLLHELAHARTPSHHHDKDFWQDAWSLYRLFGITHYALKREAGYKATATTVAVSLGIRGARVAAKTAAVRRKAVRRSSRPQTFVRCYCGELTANPCSLYVPGSTAGLICSSCQAGVHRHG